MHRIVFIVSESEFIGSIIIQNKDQTERMRKLVIEKL